MNGAQIGILKESNQVRLSGLLQRGHGAALKPQIRLEILRDLTHQPLERKLADEKLGALLVLPDLPEGHGSGPEPVRLLHAAGGGSGLPGCLGGQLLPRSLSSGGLPRRLLSTSH
uniref:Uncharacterized protein n=1 Tax=Kalanchoe fedtschenkoi TaxID=63787 RepID=A0A7N0ZUQ6_KALFE